MSKWSILSLYQFDFPPAKTTVSIPEEDDLTAMNFLLFCKGLKKLQEQNCIIRISFKLMANAYFCEIIF